jgi:putative transposase
MRAVLVEDLKAAGYSQRQALGLAGLARSVWQYRDKPRPRVAEPVPHRQRAYPNRISAADEAVIAQEIQAAWGRDDSVLNAFATCWDAGVFLASRRQWYRIANRVCAQDARPPRTPPTPRKKPNAPVVVVTGPGQAWVWDITDLKGTFVGQRFKAYSIQDLFSRAIVGHRVAAREDDQIATQMFSEAFGHAGIPQVIHADNGAAMTSNALEQLCAQVEVDMSFSRPRVSNDNAFKESEFRTLKTRPSYPGTFDSLQQAQAWIGDYVSWYNTDHRHSSLALHSPGSVHDGTWRQTHTRREQVLANYYRKHPERFRHRPVTNEPPGQVAINLHHQDADTTHQVTK